MARASQGGGAGAAARGRRGGGRPARARAQRRYRSCSARCLRSLCQEKQKVQAKSTLCNRDAARCLIDFVIPLFTSC